MITNEDQPAYMLAARGNVRVGISTAPVVVRELLERIDRDAATLARIEKQAKAAETLCTMNGADVLLAVVPAEAIRAALRGTP